MKWSILCSLVKWQISTLPALVIVKHHVRFFLFDCSTGLTTHRSYRIQMINTEVSMQFTIKLRWQWRSNHVTESDNTVSTFCALNPSVRKKPTPRTWYEDYILEMVVNCSVKTLWTSSFHIEYSGSGVTHASNSGIHGFRYEFGDRICWLTVVSDRNMQLR